MPLDSTRVRQCLKDFSFRQLFTEELGWDHQSSAVEVTVDGRQFSLLAVAEKRGMVAFHCPGLDAEDIPSYVVRRKIERQLSKSVHEHIVIFTDENETTQIWQWVRREVGRPWACREHTYHRRQPGDALIQKLQALEFRLEEEESLTIVDVAGRARAAFDVDRVTKRFYDRFKTEHSAFVAFIKGIPSQDDQAWYASLMLNRLMFVYFIQKKGFLDSDPDYLRNRLLAMQRQHGNDKFYWFYKHFLLRLFHEGLNQPIANRTGDLDELLGSVPYLNGGLFDVHRLEEQNPKIEIEDQAFQRLFDFFDSYQWHLDERPLRAGDEINPDVLGYIFEKYVNQKQMGAYYTKEDITGYIAQNTVIPFLFDAAERKVPAAFRPDSPLWRLLREDPDRYIYSAVRNSVDVPLPKDIAAGLDNVSRRDGWNRAAPAEFALPTETWREHLARRNRCLELRRKLAAGEVHSINDLITLNLDIRQFAQDSVENCETPELLRAIYGAICSVSVLDPTCGSGAFLFAALNVLEPLYEACLERMQAFVDEFPTPGAEAIVSRHSLSTAQTDAAAPDWLAAEEPESDAEYPGSSAKRKPRKKAAKPKRFADFRHTLAQVAQHPSPRYFILKSIIIGNLYGVDIMEEAVEICKLRLFLKLVAQVERVEQVEPLPDVDFNIRAGNTLVGYVSLDQIRQAIERERGGQKKLAFSDALEDVQAIEEKALIADRAYQKFREMQTQHGMDASLFTEAKRELRRRLDALAQDLDQYLAGDYGVAVRNRKAYEAWRKSHQPFHWFAEFYGIMHRGGFDVIVGNPPYVEYSKVRNSYQLRGYETLECGNMYTFVTERSIRLAGNRSHIGLIVPLSLLCTDRMGSARLLLSSGVSWIPAFDMRPASLFDGVAQRLAILLSVPKNEAPCVFFTGGYRRWSAPERESLLQLTEFTRSPRSGSAGPIPKLFSSREADVLAKISGPSIELLTDDRADPIYLHRICRYFIKAVDFVPYFRGTDGQSGRSEDYKPFLFQRAGQSTILCLLNSSLFYWFWRCHGDGFHCGYGDVFRMPLEPSFTDQETTSFEQILKKLMTCLKANSERKTIQTKRGGIEYQEFYAKPTKCVLDEIDRLFAAHFGFTDEELDFIINYDIKYRMGQDGGEEEG